MRLIAWHLVKTESKVLTDTSRVKSRASTKQVYLRGIIVSFANNCASYVNPSSSQMVNLSNLIRLITLVTVHQSLIQILWKDHKFIYTRKGSDEITN